jgi:hypothetical protein
MDNPETVGRGGRPEIVLVDDGDGESPETGIPRDAGTVNACTDDEEIESSIDESREVASHVMHR